MLTTPLPITASYARLLKAGETPIAKFGEWLLLARPRRPDQRGPWVGLRLARPRPETARSSFWLGACPERMARSFDWGALVRRHPDVAAWVEPIATNHALMISDTETVTTLEAERSERDAAHWGPER